ncbi:MAG: hypothetical protein FWF94_06310 [Oscillospiraceae bacterium]|nr:hypothetical protein [Oscillospiraceae bacterium]
MKNSSAFKIAYCGIVCAMSTLIMFTSVIPAMTYIMPALAGIIIWSVSGQINRGWAFLTFAASAFLVLFLTPEMEAKTYFIMFFGYYPLIRATLHKISFIPAQILAKLILFNAAAVSGYQIVIHIFGITDVLNDLSEFGENAVYVFWAFGNVAFFAYDFALKYVFYAFDAWIKPAINKKIK